MYQQIYVLLSYSRGNVYREAVTLVDKSLVYIAEEYSEK